MKMNSDHKNDNHNSMPVSCDDNLLQIVPCDWTEILESLKPTRNFIPNVATFGGKGVGKSTLNKWLINNLLSTYQIGPIVYIDLDPGQPQLTLPGVLSASIINQPLIGTKYKDVLVLEPARAIFFGQINISENPNGYVKCMKELADFVKKHYPTSPKIINTSGFCEGLGTTLAVEIIKIFSPNFVIQLHINNTRRCFPFKLELTEVLKFQNPSIFEKFYPEFKQSVKGNLSYKFISIDSTCHPEGSGNIYQSGLNSKGVRDKAFSSYFSNTHVPVQVNLDKVKLGCPKGYSPHNILDIINGSLVALCCNLELDIQNNILDSDQTLDYNTVELHSYENQNQFLGYGIVRAIDIFAKKLWILTPISTEKLMQIDLIIPAGTLGIIGSCIEEMSVGFSKQPQTNLLDADTKRKFIPNRIAYNRLLRSDL